METKNKNQKEIIQVEVKRIDYNPKGFDEGIVYNLAMMPVEKIYTYITKEEIKPQFDSKA